METEPSNWMLLVDKIGTVKFEDLVRILAPVVLGLLVHTGIKLLMVNKYVEKGVRALSESLESTVETDLPRRVFNLQHDSERDRKKLGRAAKRTLSVSALHFEEVKTRYGNGLVALLVLVSAYYAGYVVFFGNPASYGFVALVCLYGIIMWIDEALLRFRIRNGFFGNNEFEAREIIEYVIANADRIDIGSGGARVRIFDEAEAVLKDRARVPEAQEARP